MGINYEAATTAQLKAEISAAGRSVRSIAGELGVEYSSFTRLVNGKRGIRLQTVYTVLAVLGVDPAVFFTRVQERAESERTPD